MSEFKKNIEEYHDVSLDNIKCAAVNACQLNIGINLGV